MIPLCLMLRLATDLAAFGGIGVASAPPPSSGDATESSATHGSLLLPSEAPSLAQEPDGIQGGPDGWQIDLGAGFVTSESEDGPDEEIDFDEGYAGMLGLLYRSGAEDGGNWAFDFGVDTLFTDQDSDNPDADPVRDVSVVAVLLTGVADWGVSESISIYGGAGVGGAWMDVGTQEDALSDFEEDDGPFLAWQAKAGVRWWMNENTSWNLGYRFLNVDDAEIDDTSAQDLDFDLGAQQHIAELGVRFSL